MHLMLCIAKFIKQILIFGHFKPFGVKLNLMSNKENHLDVANEIDCHNDKTCLSQHTLAAQSRMQLNNELCDACINLDDGTTIQVHRIIMCSACEYFRYV